MLGMSSSFVTLKHVILWIGILAGPVVEKGRKADSTLEECRLGCRGRKIELSILRDVLISYEDYDKHTLPPSPFSFCTLPCYSVWLDIEAMLTPYILGPSAEVS